MKEKNYERLKWITVNEFLEMTMYTFTDLSVSILYNLNAPEMVLFISIKFYYKFYKNLSHLFPQ